MFCGSGPRQRESYLFCVEKCLEGRNLQGLFIFKMHLFVVVPGIMYKTMITLWTKLPGSRCNESAVLTLPRAGSGWPDSHSPGQGLHSQCHLLCWPHLALSCLHLGDQPSGEAPGNLGRPAIKAGGLALGGQWAAGWPLPGDSPMAPLLPLAQPPAMPRTTAIVPWASPRALSHSW